MGKVQLKEVELIQYFYQLNIIIVLQNRLTNIMSKINRYIDSQRALPILIFLSLMWVLKEATFLLDTCYI